MSKYQCIKCNCENMYTEKQGNNTGLYCSNCGKWQRWLGKDELRAFEHSQKEVQISNIQTGTLVDATQYYGKFKLNLDKINSVDDCKKILKFLCGLAIKPLPEGLEYGGFSEVSDYFTPQKKEAGECIE